MPVTIEKLSELSIYDAPVPVGTGPGDSNIPSIAMMPGRLRCTKAVQWLLVSGLHVVAIILGGILLLMAAAVRSASAYRRLDRKSAVHKAKSGQVPGEKYLQSYTGIDYNNLSIFIFVSGVKNVSDPGPRSWTFSNVQDLDSAGSS
jgi:hypothetical protein